MISDYKDLAFDLARVCCRVNCLRAMTAAEAKKYEGRKHKSELRRAMKEQAELVAQIFHNEPLD